MRSIPDKVVMVMSRPKSKVYIIRNFLHKDWHIHNFKDLLIANASDTITAFLSRPAVVSLAQLK